MFAVAGSEKFVPLIVTISPSAPLPGVKLVIVGAATVKLVALVAVMTPILTEILLTLGALVGTSTTSWVPPGFALTTLASA